MSPLLVIPQEARQQIQQWLEGITLRQPRGEVEDLLDLVDAEPERIAAAVTEADGEWSQGIADAIGEYPANPSVARDRITSIMAERIAAAERAAVVKALRWAQDYDAYTLERAADRIEAGGPFEWSDAIENGAPL